MNTRKSVLALYLDTQKAKSTMKPFFFFLICSFTTAFAQSPSFAELDASPLDVVMYRNANNDAVARVIYSRPSKRGRKIFGYLVPYGKVWRTGANEATEITFFKPVVLNGNEVPAGSYSLFTVPGPDQWDIILNEETLQWGTRYDPEKNFVTTTVESETMPSSAESFSITFIETIDGPALLLGWDDTFISVPFKVMEEKE